MASLSKEMEEFEAVEADDGQVPRRVCKDKAGNGFVNLLTEGMSGSQVECHRNNEPGTTYSDLVHRGCVTGDAGFVVQKTIDKDISVHFYVVTASDLKEYHSRPSAGTRYLN